VKESRRFIASSNGAADLGGATEREKGRRSRRGIGGRNILPRED
jgi:hypothetical protein